MKPKQLANVLVCILGLSMVAHSLSTLVSTVISWLQVASENHVYNFNNHSVGLSVWLYGLLPVGLGIILMMKSRCVVEILFKDEAE
jgi:hypothetical protein